VDSFTREPVPSVMMYLEELNDPVKVAPGASFKSELSRFRKAPFAAKFKLV
jgi:hypothetical protein